VPTKASVANFLPANIVNAKVSTVILYNGWACFLSLAGKPYAFGTKVAGHYQVY
jgi:hypothetical protein